MPLTVCTSHAHYLSDVVIAALIAPGVATILARPLRRQRDESPVAEHRVADQADHSESAS